MSYMEKGNNHGYMLDLFISNFNVFILLGSYEELFSWDFLLAKILDLIFQLQSM